LALEAAGWWVSRLLEFALQIIAKRAAVGSMANLTTEF
jgi:hypothetical protein